MQACRIYRISILDCAVSFNLYFLFSFKGITSAPAMAVAQVSSELADTIDSLHREAKRIKLPKIHRFKETGLEADDMAEVLEKLLDFKDNYDDNFEL